MFQRKKHITKKARMYICFHVCFLTIFYFNTKCRSWVEILMIFHGKGNFSKVSTCSVIVIIIILCVYSDTWRTVLNSSCRIVWLFILYHHHHISYLLTWRVPNLIKMKPLCLASEICVYLVGSVMKKYCSLLLLL